MAYSFTPSKHSKYKLYNTIQKTFVNDLNKNQSTKVFVQADRLQFRELFHREGQFTTVTSLQHPLFYVGILIYYITLEASFAALTLLAKFLPARQE